MLLLTLVLLLKLVMLVLIVNLLLKLVKLTLLKYALDIVVNNLPLLELWYQLVLLPSILILLPWTYNILSSWLFYNTDNYSYKPKISTTNIYVYIIATNYIYTYSFISIHTHLSHVTQEHACMHITISINVPLSQTSHGYPH